MRTRIDRCPGRRSRPKAAPRPWPFVSGSAARPPCARRGAGRRATGVPVRMVEWRPVGRWAARELFQGGRPPDPAPAGDLATPPTPSCRPPSEPPLGGDDETLSAPRGAGGGRGKLARRVRFERPTAGSNGGGMYIGLARPDTAGFWERIVRKKGGAQFVPDSYAPANGCGGEGPGRAYSRVV